MERARELRENAARCIRLSKCINSSRDIDILLALAAEAIGDAERMEATDAARVAKWYPASGSAAGTQDVPVPVHLSPAADLARAETLEIDRHTQRKPAAPADRRRPGRQEGISPMLIPLLRDRCDESVRDEPIDEEPDQLRASRGIVIWGLVSAAAWIALLYWFI